MRRLSNAVLWMIKSIHYLELDSRSKLRIIRPGVQISIAKGEGRFGQFSRPSLFANGFDSVGAK
jgi:hypothetical protein